MTDDDEVLRWDMQPGDALLFNSYALHGAPGNPSTTSARRRGYATRWCGDDVRYEDRPGTMNAGWVAAGFDNGLADGAPIACALHPDCARPRKHAQGPRSPAAGAALRVPGLRSFCLAALPPVGAKLRHNG